MRSIRHPRRAQSGTSSSTPAITAAQRSWWRSSRTSSAVGLCQPPGAGRSSPKFRIVAIILAGDGQLAPCVLQDTMYNLFYHIHSVRRRSWFGATESSARNRAVTWLSMGARTGTWSTIQPRRTPRISNWLYCSAVFTWETRWATSKDAFLEVSAVRDLLRSLFNGSSLEVICPHPSAPSRS